MKNILTTIALLTALTVIGQKEHKIEFTYDAAGNRTGMHLIEFTKDDGTGAKSSDKKAIARVFTQNAGKRQITVYPNPSEGFITVEITGGKKRETSTVEIFNLSGKNIIRKEKVRNRSKLDLSELPSGTYILKVLTNAKDICTWKIIKR